MGFHEKLHLLVVKDPGHPNFSKMDVLSDEIIIMMTGFKILRGGGDRFL